MPEFFQRVGAFYNPPGSHFVVWAPLKKDVKLVIEPGRKMYPMKRDEAGYWRTIISTPPGTRYGYQLDGEGVFPDPASVSQPEGVHKLSELVNRSSFVWTDDEWRGLQMKDMIIYELHTGAFSSKHVFEGVVDKLVYLKDLGINTIELMPVAGFAGQRNWGYDVVYPFAVHHCYGAMAGLKRLVNEAHRLGIAVILDVVYNHVGPEGNYLGEFAPYFTDKYNTPWGKAINFDDAWCDGVRNYYMQNALMWLNEYHVDGLRLDAVHAIWDFSASHFIKELKEHVDQIEEKTKRHKVLIAEIDLNNTRYIDPSEKGGYDLDGQWNDEFHHALHAFLTGERDGYYEDFGELEHIERAFQDTYVYNHCYSEHRKKVFGSQFVRNPFHQFVVCSQNHDQVGNRAAGDRLATLLSFDQLKLAAAAVLLSPYIPMLFMGEEYGEQNPFLFFVDYSDEQLVKVTREGRKKEFGYFNFKDDFPDPQSENSFFKSVLSWNFSGEEAQVLFAYYRQLINIRNSYDCLKEGRRDSMVMLSSKNHLLSFERKSLHSHVLVILNFNKQQSAFKNRSPVFWKKIFDSSELQWLSGRVKCDDEISGGHNIMVPPMTAVAFKSVSD